MKRDLKKNSTLNEPMIETGPGSVFLTELMTRSNMPRNQVASTSGLTNTYLRGMEQGNVRNVDRQRLIRLGLALSLELDQIDNLLRSFDRTDLTPKDIPLFLRASREMMVSGALHPVSHVIPYDLYVNGTRRIPGNEFSSLQVIAESLQASGHSTFRTRRSARNHYILDELKLAIGKEKHRTLVETVQEHRVDNVACRHCLDDYIFHCDNPEEKSFRYKHLQSLIDFLKEQENYHFYLTDVCPSFQFTLKFPKDTELHNEKVWYMGKQPRSNPHPPSKLIAFATDNPQMVATFKSEMHIVKEAFVANLLDKEKMIIHLENMLTEALNS
jgi:hypothetical protein